MALQIKQDLHRMVQVLLYLHSKAESDRFFLMWDV